MGCSSSNSSSTVKDPSSKSSKQNQGAVESLEHPAEEAEIDAAFSKFGIARDAGKIDLSFKHIGDTGFEDVSKIITYTTKCRQLNLSKV